MLAQHRDKLDAVAHALEENEVLDETEVEELIGPSAYRRAAANGEMLDHEEKPSGAAAG